MTRAVLDRMVAAGAQAHEFELGNPVRARVPDGYRPDPPAPSAGNSTNSVRPGLDGLSPMPLRSTRRLRTPAAAHIRASSTQSRPGPWCPIRPAFSRTTVGADRATGSFGSLMIPKRR